MAQSANGVLPITAAALQRQPAPNNAPRGPSARKPTPPRLKVVIRRLPPGLTQAEFQAAVGEEWRLGAGKVDWFEYKAGKISKDLAKPSRPARAYLHLIEQAHLQTLSENVQQAIFTDAKNTGKDAALIGPPVLEFAPYSRVAAGRKRNDARQGMIDQDPEFIEFLQSLTNPIQKPPGVDTETSAKKEEIKTTPLIEHIREKKAAKEKPATGRASAAAAKHGRQESKESKVADKHDKKTPSRTTKEIAASPEKSKRLSKAEKAVEKAVKVLNREAAGAAQGTAAAERRRERAANPLSVAAKIQRDLGLAPAVGKRAKREQAVAESSQTSASAGSPEATAQASPAAQPKKENRAPRGRRASKSGEPSPEIGKKAPSGPSQPTILKKPTVQVQPPKGPAAARAPPAAPKASIAPTDPASTPSEPASSAPATPTITVPAGRQAFLKHANPSQGITEPLIEEALKVFGGIDKVEIDRKKGFAYVEFTDAKGLRKAIAGSPVKIAQGAVQILERRERPVARAPVAPTAPRGGGFGRGRGGRGRGGGRGGAAAATNPPGSPATTAPAPQAASSGAAT